MLCQQGILPPFKGLDLAAQLSPGGDARQEEFVDAIQALAGRGDDYGRVDVRDEHLLLDCLPRVLRGFGHRPP